MYICVTLKLSARLIMQIARAARQKGISRQRWMLEAIEHEVSRQERFLAYVRQDRHLALATQAIEEAGEAMVVDSEPDLDSIITFPEKACT